MATAKRKKKGNRWSKDQVQRARRSKRALDLRARGFNYVQIADAIGVSRAAAHKIVQKAIARIDKESAARVKKLELFRLDTAWRENEATLAKLRRLFVKMKGHDAKLVLSLLRAEQQRLRIMDRRALYLGLDAPRPQVSIALDEAPSDRVDLNNLTVSEVRQLHALQKKAAGMSPPVTIEVKALPETTHDRSERTNEDQRREPTE